MSKQDNLTDFLADVADAIREKKGTTEKINPQNFSEEIRGIESGDNGFNAEVELINPTVCSTKNFRKVKINEGVTEIGKNGFMDSELLTDVVLPRTLIKLNQSAFQDCKSIKDIKLPESLQLIEMNCFHNCESLESFVVPKNVTHVGHPVIAQCYSLKSVVVNGENPKYDSRDNCNAVVETATNTLIAGCGISTIPNTVVKIGVYAFRLHKMTYMYFPKSVTSIETNAFEGCSYIQIYDFRHHTEVPLLAAASAITGVSTYKIYVPDNLYDEWITATNWSSLASRIVKASEFVEPTNE